MIKKVTLVNIYKHKKNKPILKNITLNFNSGEVVGIVGKNGCGKSSLFKVITGLWKPSSGDILLNDISINNKKIYDLYKISSFIERPNLYENLKVKDNFKILISLYDISDLSWFNFLYDEFNIKEFENKIIKKCSSGMKQKVGIIMSLLNDGDLIILDEPTNTLDIDSVNSLYKIIEILKEKNKIIIISSHIIDELESIIDKAIIIEDGAVKEEYIKSNFKNTYIVNFESNDSKLKFIDLKMDNYNIIDSNEDCIELEIEDLNKFMKQCLEHDISIKNINKNHQKLKSLIKR